MSAPVAVVTGAASGIGRAIALALAARGDTVAVADLDADGARATADEAGDRARGYGVDVADDDQVQTFAAAALADLGAPTVLVNCAGWDEAHPFTETDSAFRSKVIAINLMGAISVTHAFLPAMIEHAGPAGRIVNISSDAGRVGSNNETVYAGAKGGQIAFAKSLARELARHGITVNAVCPGPTDTPLFRRQPERLRHALERAVPMRRLATPQDIAEAVCFFASPGAGYITGQVLSVSGGLTMVG